MTYNIIATGSSGNAVLINENILIDIGVPWKKLEPYAKKIRLALLTHEHGDHFKPSTVRKLHQAHPAIRFGCCEWMVKPLIDAGVDKRMIDVLAPKVQYGYGEYELIAELLPHNVPNCGYRVIYLSNLGKTYRGDKWERLFYATDCSTLDGIEAKDYDLYMIEANHSRAEIEERIAAKEAAGKYAYEREAMRNHLSREQAEDWLAKNAGAKSEYVFLHQHRDDKK